ncbi:MAG: DUF721 domain-containing protein [Planctomycetota bacterium]|nr:DUF721 domain-containing protein [Planctomycetota bacterium]
MGDLVAKVVEAAGLDRGTQRSALVKAWREAVGREIAAQTEVQGLRGGVLTVLVGSAALSHELMVYYRRDLLTRLREQTSIPITDLRCKVTGAEVPEEDRRGGHSGGGRARGR